MMGDLFVEEHNTGTIIRLWQGQGIGTCLFGCGRARVAANSGGCGVG